MQPREDCAAISKQDFEFQQLIGKPMAYDAIESQVKFLQGKVLTIIEAALTNPNQLEAVKSLVKKTFSEQLDWIYKITRCDEVDAKEGVGTILESPADAISDRQQVCPGEFEQAVG